MLKLHNLSKIFRTDEVETVALNSVNIEIDTGEFVAIMGPSGCGKSTLLNIIGMLDSPSSGDYLFQEENVQPLDRRDEIARIGLLLVRIRVPLHKAICHKTLCIY